MANTEKKKKHKHPHTEMANATCRINGCGHPIKLNVVERTPGHNYTCYFHGLLESGKTHLSGQPIKDLLRLRNRRMAVK